METFEVKWNRQDDEYYVNIPIDNQTLYMAFQLNDWSYDTVYINVGLSVFNKRKHKDYNEDHILMTGLNPLATAILARKAFKMLEKETLFWYNKYNRVIIYCTWVDNVRRDIYYKVLSKMGYHYGTLNGKKVILRSWKKGEWFRENQNDSDNYCLSQKSDIYKNNVY